MTKLPEADSVSVHFSTQFSIHFFQDHFHFQSKKQLQFQSSRVCPLATFTSTKIFSNRPQDILASFGFSTFSFSVFLQGKFWIYSVSPKSPSGFAHLLFRFFSKNVLTLLHMGPKHALREKILSMVIFFIFVQKNVSRIRFQEIKIRPWKGFEKMRFLCFYIIGV